VTKIVLIKLPANKTLVLDLEYERNNFVSRMPDNVKYFLINFFQAIKEGVLFDIQNENTFQQTSDKGAWPDQQEVAALVDNDKVFLVLYKEIGAANQLM